MLGAFIGIVLISTFYAAASSLGSVSGEPYVQDFPTTGAWNVMLAQGDGQAFASLARDPSMSRPELFRGQEAELGVGVEMAYRQARPLYGWLAWAMSFGQPDLVPPALALLSVAGCALLVGSASLLLKRRRYSRPSRAVLLLLLPGAVSSLSWMGPEVFGLGAAFLGIERWYRRDDADEIDRRLVVQAIGLFLVSALCRETMLVIPATLGFYGLLVNRSLRDVAPLLAIPAVYFGWLTVVRLRLGAWPWDASANRTGIPGAGFVQAVQHFGVADVGLLALTLASVGIAVRFRRDVLAWTILLCSFSAFLFGERLWGFRDVSRLLLPAHAIALLFVMTWRKGALPMGPPRWVTPMTR